VERGDTINAIANKNGITEELLMKANGIDNPRLLRVGQKLKVPNVNWSIEVDIASNTLQLRNHGELFKLYRVRTGREAGATPVGEFKLLNKKTNPTWRPGNGLVYPPGDPNNELGTRWMSFEGDILGIHGTVHPNTVGHYASNGCVGMTKEDVEELFDLVTVGTPLTIKGQQDLTKHKVIPAPEIPPPMEMAKR
jgi:LysM repeat protein